jgi:hypothetical protein
MFIRCDTRPADVDLATISYEDLAELSWDRVQQQRLDNTSDDAEDAAWDRLLAAKWEMEKQRR